MGATNCLMKILVDNEQLLLLMNSSELNTDYIVIA